LNWGDYDLGEVLPLLAQDSSFTLKMGGFVSFSSLTSVLTEVVLFNAFVSLSKPSL
jgi:hypothetical protein